MRKELVTCVRMYGVFFCDYYQTKRYKFYFYSNEERLKYFSTSYSWDFQYLEPQLFTIEQGEIEYKKSMDYVNSEEYTPKNR